MGISRRLPGAAIGAAAVGLVLAANAASAAVPGQLATGRNVSSMATLMGVDSVSATDAWAVGELQTEGLATTLVEHWNGTSWQQVPSPNPGGVYGSTLTSVTAIAGNDVWAVGSYGALETGPRTLILHWNGMTWSQVASPNPSAAGENRLNAVTAVSPDDIWAVGWHTSSTLPAVTLTEHWNGVHWTEVPSPNPSHRLSNVLSGVSAVSTKDVWAVGSFSPGSNKQSTLVVRWNGKHWSRPLSPSPGALSNQLFSVSARASKDVWAVGDTSSLAGQTLNLIERWDGVQWLEVQGPDLGTLNSSLTSVSAQGKKNAWAVGYVEADGVRMTLTLHWDGLTWTRVPSPNPGALGSTLHAVLTEPDSAWAVGTTFVSAIQADPLIARWDGDEWYIW